MNLRVVDEHGRQLGMGRNLGALKAELGAQARGAFQALAGAQREEGARTAPAPAAAPGATPARAEADAAPALPAGQRYTAWTFGELPELMEVRRGAQSLIGFPALVDGGDAVDDRGVRRARRWRRRSTAPACAVCSRCRSRTRSSTWKRTSPTCRRWRGLHAAGHAGGAARSRSSTWRWSAPSCWSRCPPTRPPSSAGSRRAAAG